MPARPGLGAPRERLVDREEVVGGVGGGPPRTGRGLLLVAAQRLRVGAYDEGPVVPAVDGAPRGGGHLAVPRGGGGGRHERHALHRRAPRHGALGVGARGVERAEGREPVAAWATAAAGSRVVHEVLHAVQLVVVVPGGVVAACGAAGGARGSGGSGRGGRGERGPREGCTRHTRCPASGHLRSRASARDGEGDREGQGAPRMGFAKTICPPCEPCESLVEELVRLPPPPWETPCACAKAACWPGSGANAGMAPWPSLPKRACCWAIAAGIATVAVLRWTGAAPPSTVEASVPPSNDMPGCTSAPHLPVCGRSTSGGRDQGPARWMGVLPTPLKTRVQAVGAAPLWPSRAQHRRVLAFMAENAPEEARSLCHY